jgi:hypothetical protein
MILFAEIWPDSVQRVVSLGSSWIKNEVDLAHATKAYRGVGLQRHSFFNSVVYGVGSHFDASAALTPVNGRVAPIE